MEATIKIDGKDVRFKSTAAVPLLYRRKFNRDLFRDMSSIAAGLKTGSAGGDLPVEAMTAFERLAYIMAKHADPDGVPDSPEEWLIESLQRLSSSSGLSSSESPSETWTS